MIEHVGTPVARKKKTLKKELWEWAKSIGIALVLALLIRTFVFMMILVEGPSMKDTLHTGDRIAVTIIDMKINGPARGDIVVCQYPDHEKACIKRVIGMPGETIEIKNGVTYINGEALEEDYVVYPKNETIAALEIPEGHYYVLGDNRSNSNDSRNPAVGTLPRSEIKGKARLMIWPLSRFHVID